MTALPVPKKGQLSKKHFFILAYNVFPLEKTSTSTTALCQWGFGYVQDTGNKYREAKGAIWEKCFLSSEQYLFAGVLCHTTIYHS